MVAISASLDRIFNCIPLKYITNISYWNTSPNASPSNTLPIQIHPLEMHRKHKIHQMKYFTFDTATPIKYGKWKMSGWKGLRSQIHFIFKTFLWGPTFLSGQRVKSYFDGIRRSWSFHNFTPRHKIKWLDSSLMDDPLTKIVGGWVAALFHCVAMLRVIPNRPTN